MRPTRALFGSLLLASAVAAAVACDGSNPVSAVDAGASEPEAGTCDPGDVPSNAECLPSTSLVCNVSGTSVACCPPAAPFYCPNNNDCYATAALAYVACGSVPHTCFACAAPPDASTGDDSGEDAAEDSSATDASADASTSDASVADASSADAGEADARAHDASDAASE